MKLKLFTLGLLATFAITNVEAMQKQQAKAAMQNPVVHEAHTNLTNILGAAGGGDVEARAAHIQALLEPGADLTTGIGHVNALLHAGGAADAHGKATAINTLIGATRATASRRGKGVVPVAAVQGDIHAKLTAILARLKAGLAANAGIAIVTIAETKTTHTPAGNALAGGDRGAAAGAGDIETFLTEIGW